MQIAQLVAQSWWMRVVPKLLFVTVAQDYPELLVRPVRPVQQELLALMVHLVQVDLEMERDMVLVHLALVHVMMLLKLNSSTYLLADNSQ
jgi:hypothetical protein